MEARLTGLVANYSNIEILHPLVSELCQTPGYKRKFHKAVTHDLKVIAARSDDLADHEINVYQKAFKILMGKDEDRIGGIEVYVDEVLGLRFVGPADRTHTLRATIDIRSSIQTDTTSSGSQPVSAHEQDDDVRTNFRSFETLPCELEDDDPDEELFLSEEPEPKVTPQARNLVASTLAADNEALVVDACGDLTLDPEAAHLDPDTKLDRIWSVYESARKDFASTKSGTESYTKAARFLRDTIENGINYIEGSQSSLMSPLEMSTASDNVLLNPTQQKLVQMRSSLEEVTEIVNRGFQGRKRRFEQYGVTPIAKNPVSEGRSKRPNNSYHDEYSHRRHDQQSPVPARDTGTNLSHKMAPIRDLYEPSSFRSPSGRPSDLHRRRSRRHRWKRDDDQAKSRSLFDGGDYYRPFY